MARIPETELERLRNGVSVQGQADALGVKMKKGGKDLPASRSAAAQPVGTGGLRQARAAAAICALSPEQLVALRELGCSRAGFQLAHQLLKGRAAEGK